MLADLVRVRRENNLTQKDVAKLMGVSQQAVNKVERYDADPRLSTSCASLLAHTLSRLTRVTPGEKTCVESRRRSRRVRERCPGAATLGRVRAR